MLYVRLCPTTWLIVSESQANANQELLLVRSPYLAYVLCFLLPLSFSAIIFVVLAGHVLCAQFFFFSSSVIITIAVSDVFRVTLPFFFPPFSGSLFHANEHATYARLQQRCYFFFLFFFFVLSACEPHMHTHILEVVSPLTSYRLHFSHERCYTVPLNKKESIISTSGASSEKMRDSNPDPGG